jgi:hypothetical protein
MDGNLPATRSAFDIAFRLLELAFAANDALSPRKLRFLMYLAQTEFAARHDGEVLMPAVFVRAADGPEEPNVAAALAAGIARPWSPTLAPRVEDFLQSFWHRFGRLPTMALERLAASDPVKSAPPKPVRPPKAPVATPAARPMELRHEPAGETPLRPIPEGSMLGFTADGRAVSRWRPKRRIDSVQN